MPRIPKRLKKDAIIEAVLELRFDFGEMVPEVIIGRLVDRPEWKGFKRNRLPISDFPEQFRLADANLRVQPLIELVAPDATRSVKIGTNVLSFHNTKKYIGWDTGLKDELGSTIDFLANKIDGLKVRRIGLRYINALTPSQHFISSPEDLNINVSLNGEPLNRPFNLNYIDIHQGLIATTRIATKELVMGPFAEDFSVYIDIDVYTPDEFVSSTADEVKRVVEEAHTRQLEVFFSLIPETIIDRLEGEA